MLEPHISTFWEVITMVLSINHPNCTPNSCRKIVKIPALDDPRLGRALPGHGFIWMISSRF